MESLATLFSLNNWPGHLSYVLIAISYWLTDIFWLRLVAIVGLSFDLDDAQIARLLLAGEFCEIADGTTLAKEGETLERLYFLCTGRVDVTIGSRAVSNLERGNFVGEVAFLTEKPATATVIADGAVRALVFDKDRLTRFFRNESDVAGLIYQLLGRELAHKMKISNTLIATVRT